MSRVVLGALAIIAVVSLGLVAVACGGRKEAAVPTPDPKDLVAQLSDLPGTGYSIVEENPASLEDALENRTPDEIALMKAERVAGYDIVFEFANVHAIRCQAVVYRSSESAETLYRIGVEAFSERAEKDGVKAEPVTINKALGDEADAFSLDDQDESGFVVMWRDRNVLSLCLGAGSVPTDPSEIVRVAQAQQQRIAAALD